MNQNLPQNLQETPYTQAAAHSDEIDLMELWQAIWSQKIKIILTTFVFAVAAVMYALSQPNLYKSEALLAPAEAEQGGGKLAALAGQFGGLASLAGVDLGGAGGGSTEEAMAILESRQFITQFVRENDLLVPLFALQPVAFTKGVEISPEIYNEQTQQWVREVKPPYTKEPTDWEIHKSFKEILSVATDKTSGLITVSIEWYNPEQAQQWVTLLVEKINAQMKKRDVDEAKKSIAFIKEKINEVSLVDMQAIFYGLIESHGRTIMLAEVRDEYAFRTIDPAVVPLEKSKPKRALICVLGTLLGGMLGVLWALIGHFSSKRTKDELVG